MRARQPTPAGATTSTAARARTALFVATNGVGMGHLTRVMAIARRLPEGVQPILLTWSQALRLARQEGFFVEYMPSLQYLRSEVRPWNALFLRRLHELIDLYAPGVIVYDGVQPHEAFDTLRWSHPAVTRVWCRRAMWRPGQAVRNLDGARFFDAVLEPGELADSSDAGATVAERPRAHRVRPMLFPAVADLLERDEARRRLGLTGERPVTLIQLGSGAALRREVIERLLALNRTDVVLAVSPLDDRAGSVPAGCRRIDLYPLGPYYRAFDFAVAAPGYNAFHELLAFGIPTLFIPNPNAVVDDQPARAGHAARYGMAATLESPDGGALDRALLGLIDGPRPSGLDEASRALLAGNGAADAASFLTALLDGSPRP